MKKESEEIIKYFKENQGKKNFEDFFSRYSYDYIIKTFNKGHNSIETLFLELCNTDINKFIEYTLQNNELFIGLIKSYTFVSLSNLTFENFSRCIKKCEELEQYNNMVWFLNKNINTEYKLYMIKYCDINVYTRYELITYLTLEEKNILFQDTPLSLALYNDINFLSCLGCKINRNIILKKDFFNKIYKHSILELRNNIDELSINNDSLLLEQRLYQYLESLLNDYNLDKGLFNIYYKFINDDIITDEIPPFFEDDILYDESKNDIKYYKAISNLKLSELVITLLFKTNYYYFMIDMKEMLNYNRFKWIIDDDRLQLYNKFLKIDDLTPLEKMNLYFQYKDKELNSVFYNDYRKVKDTCYEDINNSLFSINDNIFLDKELSDKYNIKIYNLKDECYYMLLRNIPCNYSDTTKNNRACYTLISNNNTTTIRNNGFTYGYSMFDINKVIHISNNDAYSSNYDRSRHSYYVNQLLSPKELTEGFYSEIQILNEKNNDDMFNTLKPNYIVNKDSIEHDSINECRRLNIPLVLIKSKDKGLNYNINDNTYPNEYAENELKIKRLVRQLNKY